MAKVNVSLPDELLEQVDELAAELDRSRSGLVQEATAQYVAHVREVRAAAERRASIEEAIAGMRSLSAKVADFDAAAAIRADRDSDYGHTDPARAEEAADE
jgi:metal-responsive CopG/Arc/MetJ family transcriptional regulator